MKIGATDTINLLDKNINFSEECKKICGSKGIDVIVETTGIPSLINAAYEMLSENGRLIMVGQPKKGEDIILKSASDNFKGKKILYLKSSVTRPLKDSVKENKKDSTKEPKKETKKKQQIVRADMFDIRNVQSRLC